MSGILSRLARKTVSLGSRIAGVRPVLRHLAAGRLAVVMYHGVTDATLAVPNWCQLPLAAFREQMEFLSRCYTPIALGEALARLDAGKPLPRCPVAVTFDDGFRNFATTAFPVLEKLGIPATVYLVTSLVGTGQPAWPERLFHALASTAVPEIDGQPLATSAQRAAAYTSLGQRLKRLPDGERLRRLDQLHDTLGVPDRIPPASPLATMDWDEAQKLATTGRVEFGSHTHTHPILSRCTEAEQEDELRRSRDILRERLGQAEHLAYPNGTAADFTPATQRLAAELGYASAASTVEGLNGPGADRFALRRVNVGAETTLREFEMMLLGW